jgi:hypothetical protein
MDGHCGTDAARFRSALNIQVLAADARCGTRLVGRLSAPTRPADLGALLQQFGRAVPAQYWNEDRFEALKIEDEEGNIFVYSIYDRACEYHNVSVLRVGQLDEFKAAAALGLIN